MSAVPEYLGLPPWPRERPRPETRPDSGDAALQSFWHWFAIGVLIFCWIAEATLCAERGF